MKIQKKLLALLLTITMTAGMSTNVFAGQTEAEHLWAGDCLL